MKEFTIFVCTDSTEIFFSKLRSAGLNYNLPCFFTESYCAEGGGSNKHCLLTFFINTFLASGNYFCHLLITFANSSGADQDCQNVGPDLDPNCLTL